MHDLWTTCRHAVLRTSPFQDLCTVDSPAPQAPDDAPCLQEITGAVTRAGATHIQFNPLADTFTARALVAVAEKEGLRLSKEAAKQCALQASGDLFHAIECLQLSCAGKPRTKIQASPAKKVGEALSDGLHHVAWQRGMMHCSALGSA